MVKYWLQKLPVLLENPQSVPYVAKEIVIDSLNDLRKWPYPNHVIFIAGLPKGGSTWLFSLLCRIPGYNPCPGVLRPLLLTEAERWNHDISQRMLDALPRSKFTVVKQHTRPTAENIELLKSNNIKTVVLVRDLRNMAVARYRHERIDKSSWCHRLYNEISREEGMWHNLHVVVKHYVPWVRGWRKVCEEDTGQMFFLVTYEEMLVALSSILFGLFYWYRIEFDIVDKILLSEARKTAKKRDFHRNINLKVPTRERSTYSGEQEDWRGYFTDEQLRWFTRQGSLQR